jgi:hypothetical protein
MYGSVANTGHADVMCYIAIIIIIIIIIIITTTTTTDVCGGSSVIKPRATRYPIFFVRKTRLHAFLPLHLWTPLYSQQSLRSLTSHLIRDKISLRCFILPV